MMSKYIKNAAGSLNVTWLDVSKLLFLVFLLYMNWYKEVRGDVSAILYGSVLLLTISLLLPFGEEDQRHIDLTCMTEFYKVLLVFGIYCLISGVIVSYYKALFFSSIITFFCYLVVLFDCCLISRRDGGWEWLLKEMLCVAIICSFQTVLFGKGMMNGGAIAITMGELNNPNALAHVVLIGIISLASLNKNTLKNIWILILLLLLMAYTILISGSRKNLISLGLFLMVWGYSARHRIKFAKDREVKAEDIIALILVAVVAVCYFISRYVNTDQYNRLLRVFTGEDETTYNGRIGMLKDAFSIWSAHPIFGIGYDQYKIYSGYGGYSHSTYAEVLSCTGVIGTLILFIPIIRYLFIMINSIANTENEVKSKHIMCFAGLIIELFLGIGQIWIYGITHELFLVCILGKYDEYYRQYTNEIKSEREGSLCRYIK